MSRIPAGAGEGPGRAKGAFMSAFSEGESLGMVKGFAMAVSGRLQRLNGRRHGGLVRRSRGCRSLDVRPRIVWTSGVSCGPTFTYTSPIHLCLPQFM